MLQKNMERILPVEFSEVAAYTLPIIATMTGEKTTRRLKGCGKLKSFRELPETGAEGNGGRFLVQL